MAEKWKDQLRGLQDRLGGKDSSPKDSRDRGGGANESKAGRPRRLSEDEDFRQVFKDPDEPEGSGRELPQDYFPREPSSAGRTINLGIDFGTSTTKVCARSAAAARNTDPVYAVRLGADLLCPSTVTFEGGRIFFGFRAEEVAAGRAGSRCFRQLKICMGCEAQGAPGRPVAACSSMRDGDRCSAIFSELRGSPDFLLASEIAALFIGWAMREARNQLPVELTGGDAVRTSYSLSVPLDHLEFGSKLNETYARAAFQAWRLSEGIDQGVDVSTAVRWLKRAEELPLPNDGESVVELCSESCAPVAAYVLSPEAATGLYCSADIGAWTTEIAFFRVSDVDRARLGRSTMAFYAAQTHRIAANSIDERTRRCALEIYELGEGEHPLLAQDIREQRESGTLGALPVPLSVRPEPIPPSALAFSRNVIAHRLGSSFTVTLKMAYSKENRSDVWDKNLRLVPSGGGANEPVLVSELGRHRFFSGPTLSPLSLDVPRNLANAEGADYRRLAVAYGLSFSSATWPIEIRPSAVLPFTFPTRHRPDPEDLGYQNP